MTIFVDEQQDEIAGNTVLNVYLFLARQLERTSGLEKVTLTFLSSLVPLISRKSFMSILMHEKLSGGSLMLMLTW
jgi:hypothetical protein